MMTVRKDLFAASFLLSIPIANVAYKVLNNRHEEVYSLVTDLDRAIPFLKVFILPYVGWYFFLFFTLIYFFFKDRATYYTTLGALNLGLVISFLIYWLYQTTVPRPELIGNDFLTRMVAYVYNTDQPFNCFPSIHSLTSFIMIKAIRQSPVRNRFNTIVICAGAVLIIASTLLVKQHVLLDVISAILLGEVTFKAVSYWNREKAFAWIGALPWTRKQYSSLMMKKRSLT